MSQNYVINASDMTDVSNKIRRNSELLQNKTLKLSIASTFYYKQVTQISKIIKIIVETSIASVTWADHDTHKPRR